MFESIGYRVFFAIAAEAAFNCGPRRSCVPYILYYRIDRAVPGALAVTGTAHQSTSGHRMSHREKSEFSRRQFLSLSAATLGTQLLRAEFSATAHAQELQKTRMLVIPHDGWRLWPDVHAEWKDDPLFLPDEVNLDTLPVNQPTGGWTSLNASQGIPVTLPTSVEEHFWGKIMSRSYHERDENREYEFADNDPQVKNGAYRGVAWFWRTIDVPEDFAGRSATLRIRNFRQRVEVFWNSNLAGYDLVAETAYSCDVTRFLKPGQPNLLAIRITNPGGIYDWRDFTSLRWGKYVFQAGRGFGGLDRGMTLVSHSPIHFEDAWVLNRPDMVSVAANAKLTNRSGEPVQTVARFSILDKEDGRELLSGDSPVRLKSGETTTVSQVLHYPEAHLWSSESPSLYVMQFHLIDPGENRVLDSCERTFGFRWFTPEGIGTNARLTFNGQRIRLYSAIEFGFWGFNGLWPSTELADKQVKAAKAFGLNTLQYHRNLAKQEAIDADDRLGLIRYMEPGGGWLAFGDQGYSFSTTPTQPPVDTSGDGAARTFSERYTEWRIRRMIQDFRSHPSLVMYCVQNEINPDLHNKRIFRIMKMMHQEDPSRTIILHSGPNVANQVFYLPYNDQIHLDNGTGYSGWADVHTVAGPGVWQDSLYVDPRNYTQSSNNFHEVSVHGEMLGWASADNHELMVENIRRNGGHGYDLQDHEAPLKAYADFLNKWGFQQAFPTPGALFVDIGNKVYDAWSKILPIIRLSEASDYLVINGWETQAIDNHSGLVDNQRNFKGDPALIASGLARLRPLAQPRGLVHKRGEKVLLDLFLLNETGRKTDGELRLSLQAPSGRRIELGSYQIPAWDQDRFVYPIREAVQTPPLAETGHYKVHFRIDDGNTHAQGDSDLFSVEPFRSEITGLRIGVIGSLCALQSLLEDQDQIRAEIYDPSKKYDVLVALEENEGWSLNFADAISNLQVALLTSVRSGTPLLLLANGPETADQYAKTLDRAGVIHYRGMVGGSRVCWMGNWVFVRRHASYEGLPVDQVMKWEYQVDYDHSSGLLVDGEGVEVFAGYGRDHDAMIGAATFSARMGRGTVLFQAVRGMQPVVYRKFTQNALVFLTSGAAATKATARHV